MCMQHPEILVARYLFIKAHHKKSKLPPTDWQYSTFFFFSKKKRLNKFSWRTKSLPKLSATKVCGTFPHVAELLLWGNSGQFPHKRNGRICDHNWGGQAKQLSRLQHTLPFNRATWTGADWFVLACAHNSLCSKSPASCLLWAGHRRRSIIPLCDSPREEQSVNSTTVILVNFQTKKPVVESG